MKIVDLGYPPEVQRGLHELEHLVRADLVLARISELHDEAATGPISLRYSRTALAGAGAGGLHNPAPAFKDLAEDEYQRQLLQHQFDLLRHRFLSVTADITNAFLELRASQLEYGPIELDSIS